MMFLPLKEPKLSLAMILRPLPSADAGETPSGDVAEFVWEMSRARQTRYGLRQRACKVALRLRAVKAGYFRPVPTLPLIF